MGQIKSFKELLVWQKSMGLVRLVYALCESLPPAERFCLSEQMRRAAISIPSNIAEGFRRQHNKELKQFLCIARSSLAELETQILIATQLYLIEKSLLDESLQLIDYISRMLWNLGKRF
jgi:four helix bundle protein